MTFAWYGYQPLRGIGGLIMTTARKLALLMFPLVSSFLSTAWCSEQPQNTLVNLFCDTLVFGTRAQVEPLVRNDTAWKGFVRALEEETKPPPHAVNDRLLDDYDRCIAAHQAVFETGEFILRGKRLLTHNAEAIENDEPGEKVALVEGEVRFPEVGEIAFDFDVGRKSQSLSKGMLDERRERYEKLWRNFLNDLRKALSVSDSPELRQNAQVLKKAQ